MKKFLLCLCALVLMGAGPSPVKKLPDGGVLINTSSLKAEDGFMGPTPLILHLDAKGRITRIEALPNQETPEYWKMAFDELCKAWYGVPAAQVASHKVDAVSGATYSSEGIISNVRAGIAYYIDLRY